MFDFYRTFAAYSTTDLLKIIAQPSLYQPEAVQAAERLLAERKVSDDERAQAAEQIRMIEERKQKPDVVTKVGTTTARTVWYLFTPSTRFDMRKWNYWLCIGLVVYNVFAWVNGIRFLVFTLRCDTCHLTPVNFITVVTLVYLPVMITLLLFQKRWGWILLLAYCCGEIIGSLSLVGLYGKYGHERWLTVLMQTFVFALLLQFLARPRVVVFFKGTYPVLKKTIAVSIAGCLLFWLLLIF
jgi:hypothetical protein